MGRKPLNKKNLEILIDYALQCSNDGFTRKMAIDEGVLPENRWALLRDKAIREGLIRKEGWKKSARYFWAGEEAYIDPEELEVEDNDNPDEDFNFDTDSEEAIWKPRDETSAIGDWTDGAEFKHIKIESNELAIEEEFASQNKIAEMVDEENPELLTEFEEPETNQADIDDLHSIIASLEETPEVKAEVKTEDLEWDFTF